MKTIKDYMNDYDRRTYRVLLIILVCALVVAVMLIAVLAAG